MDDLPAIEQERLALLQQVKASFTGSSLTLLSIVQAAALAELAGVVAQSSIHFTVVHWLMALVTLFLLIVIWDHLSRDAMTFAWIPDFRDSAIPFMIGVMELFVSHAVDRGIEVWLIGMEAMAICALIHLAYVRWRAEKSAENRHVLAYSRQRWRAEWALSIAGIVLVAILGTGGASGLFVAGEEAKGAHGVLAVGAVLLVGIWLAGYVLSTHFSWQAAVEHAQIDDTLR